jgi:glycerophosphoryl diester phosphodiesterase
MSINRTFRRAGTAAAALVLAPAIAAGAACVNGPTDATLVGRAVLPVNTYAPGPQSGAFYTGPANGITFPTPSQPVEGFSGIVEGHDEGEYLMMPDNGFGSKASSVDFLIRAYEVTPHFKTAKGGSGAVSVDVKHPVNFRDPDHKIGFTIVRETTRDRQLTGGDIDPESIQRGSHGELWVGDEFGPWILHFDAKGTLLEAPIPMPDGLRSPNNPAGQSGVNNSRGIEAMAMSPDGRTLTVILEGAVIGDGALSRRIYQYDIASRSFQRRADYQVDFDASLTQPEHFVSDAQSLDDHRLVVIERDGTKADARHVYVVDLDTVVNGAVTKTAVVDLAAIRDPNGVSLPAIHPGDVGIGDPFRVMCESIEAVRVVSPGKLLLGCDNNFPNKGRNPGLADDNEFIVVRVPGL